MLSAAAIMLSSAAIMFFWSDYSNENLKIIVLMNSVYSFFGWSSCVYHLYLQFLPKEKHKLMWDTGHWVVLFSMSHASHRKHWPLPVPASIKAPGKDNIMGMDHTYISFYQSHFTSQQEWHINSLSIPNIHTSFWFYIPSLQRFWIVSLEVLNGER